MSEILNRKHRVFTVGEIRKAKIEDLPPYLHKIKHKIDEDFKNDLDIEDWDKIFPKNKIKIHFPFLNFYQF